MDLALTDEQTMLRESVKSFMGREVTMGRATNRYWNGGEYDEALYAAAARAGWIGMLVPEGLGGAGAQVTDAAIVFEGLGAAPLPAPVFSGGVLVPEILLEAANDEQKRRVLPEICSGSTIGALALSDQATLAWGPDCVESRAEDTGANYVLNGLKPFVQDGQRANLFVVAAHTAGSTGISLFLVEGDRPGVTVTPRIDLLSSVAEVRLKAVEIRKDALVGELGGGWPAIERCLARTVPVLGAMKVGACQQIFDAAVEYTKERVAFGQPIGRFQRVQDHMVDLAIQMDSARWITYETAWKIDRGDEAMAFVHEAKAVASEAYYQVVNQAHKVYAGPGTDLDHPLMAHHAASRVLYQFLGDPAHHKLKMMDELFPIG